jgi:hypothetical protein
VLLTLGARGFDFPRGDSFQHMKILASNTTADGAFTTLAVGVLRGAVDRLQDIYIPSVQPYRYLRVQLAVTNSSGTLRMAPNASYGCHNGCPNLPAGAAVPVWWSAFYGINGIKTSIGSCDACWRSDTTFNGGGANSMNKFGWGVNLQSLDVFTGRGDAADAGL